MKDAEIKHFEDYRSHVDPEVRKTEDNPWSPFRCRVDFEFAEVAFKAALNADQSETLIRIINDVASGRANFTLKNHKDLTDTWTQASALLTPASVSILFFCCSDLLVSSQRKSLIHLTKMDSANSRCITVSFGTGLSIF